MQSEMAPDSWLARRLGEKRMQTASITGVANNTFPAAEAAFKQGGWQSSCDR